MTKFSYLGKLYDTNNSTRICMSCFDVFDEYERSVETLYKNRGGAFFVVAERSTRQWGEYEALEILSERTIFPLTQNELPGWVEQTAVEIFEDEYFADLPEAKAEEQQAKPAKKK
jgi:hypothetical protein